jgi:hypothetical protein
MPDRSRVMLFIMGLISGCSGSAENIFEYPDGGEVELHLTVSETHLVVQGHQFFRDHEIVLLVKVLDKDFSATEDASLECFLHNKGRRIDAKSLDRLSPGNFKVTVEPTWAGQGTMTLRVRGKDTDAVFKLKIMVNQ